MDHKMFLEYVNGNKTTQSCVEIIKKPDLEFTHHIDSLINEFVSVKGLIKYIDFQCEIVEGGCKETPYAKRCCCHDCKNNVGYIHLMFEHDLKFYARHFSGKTGFWRKGKGCILPHHRRSTTCLTHNCNHTDKGYKHFAKGIFEVGRLLKATRVAIIDTCAKGV